MTLPVYFFLLCHLFRSSLSASLASDDVLVKDTIFTTEDVLGMRSLLSQEKTVWTFRANEQKYCYCWSTNLTSHTFSRSSAWRKLSDTLSSHFRSQGGWRILEIEGQINIRAKHSCTKQFSGNASSYIAVIFLVGNWRRNGYGELVVYMEGEILKAVYPKRGRVVIFPASLEHVIKPPAIDLSDRLYLMKIHLLLSDQKRLSDTESNEQSADSSSRTESYPFVNFASFKLLHKTNTAPSEKLDVKQFITRNFTTSDGRHIIVLDNILPPRELDALRYITVSSGYSDDPASEDSGDNVQWIMAFEVNDFLQTSLWQLVSQIVTTVSGKEGFYPYDIGCNNIQSIDTTIIHTDCEPYEDEYTLLIYLNQNWTENHHGETVFLSDMDGSEVIFAVRPRYGRVAIFHGTIPHSARPPPLTYAGMDIFYALSKTNFSGLMVSALYWDQAVWVEALVRDIVLCFQTRHFTLSVSLHPGV